MKDMEFTVADIKDLMNAFSKNRLGSMELSQGTFSLRLESREAGQTVVAAHSAAADSVVEGSGADMAAPRGNIVKCPIVGTFYAAPAPDKPPYVTVGQTVKKGDVLFIIESMKLMNEVTSDFDGVVDEILVQNGVAVEYGQPVMAIV